MMTGKVNTSVLPEPVKAMPIMSRPDRLSTKDRPAGQLWRSAHRDCFSGCTAAPAQPPSSGPWVRTHMVGIPWI